MPVFKCFFKIILKHKIGIIIYLGIFAVLGILFTTDASDNKDSEYKDSVIPIAVIDRDEGKLSNALKDYLGERHVLIELKDDIEILQDALFYRNVEYILMIPDGFEKGFLNEAGEKMLENTKLPGSASGIYIDGQIDRFILSVKVYLETGHILDEALMLAAADLNLGVTVKIYNQTKEGETGSAFYFQFLAYILMAVIICAIGPALMTFNKSDLAKRIESSSLKLKERNLQLVLGCMTASAAIWIMFIIIAFLLYGNEMYNMVSGLRILNIFIYLFVCISLTFLLCQLLKTVEALNSIVNVICLGMSFLCGIFVPLELLGPGVLSIAKFLPAYWYIRNNDMLFYAADIGNVNITIYAEGIGVQIGFAAVLFVAALIISRQKKINSMM